jgi:hypothetical protein
MMPLELVGEAQKQLEEGFMEKVGWNPRTLSKGRMAKASDVDDLPRRND